MLASWDLGHLIPFGLTVFSTKEPLVQPENGTVVDRVLFTGANCSGDVNILSFYLVYVFLQEYLWNKMLCDIQLVNVQLCCTKRVIM